MRLITITEEMVALVVVQQERQEHKGRVELVLKVSMVETVERRENMEPVLVAVARARWVQMLLTYITRLERTEGTAQQIPSAVYPRYIQAAVAVADIRVVTVSVVLVAVVQAE